MEVKDKIIETLRSTKHEDIETVISFCHTKIPASY